MSSTITFDMMQFIDTLTSAGVPEAQAKAEAKAVSQAISSAVDITLATKKDIELIRKDIEQLRVEIAHTKLDAIKWLVALVLGQTALLMTVLPKLMAH
jgi:DNA-binding helix-hairpin-helix protein with protein kinase domain